MKYGRPADTEYKVPGELVGVDTFTVGYNGKLTLGGKRFCTVFVDYATRHVKIYLYTTMAQRLHMFRNYIGWAASQGVVVRAFRTDSAREWLVKDLEKYFHAKGSMNRGPHPKSSGRMESQSARSA